MIKIIALVWILNNKEETMKSNDLKTSLFKIHLFAAAACLCAVATAEETDMFSRANCINNESITYDLWAASQWRLTFSTHVKDSTNHYVASGPFVGCDIYGCWYAYEYTTWAPAVHAGEGFSGGWTVYGDHRHYYPGVGFSAYYTSATDCNLSFDQFN